MKCYHIVTLAVVANKKLENGELLNETNSTMPC